MTDFLETAEFGAKILVGLIAFVITLPVTSCLWVIGRLARGRIDVEFR